MVRTAIVVLSCALAAPAAAQVLPDEPSGADPGAGGEAELDEDPTPIGGDDDGDENPDAPRLLGEDPAPGPTAPKARPTGYPRELVLRPLTLPDFTSEIEFGASLYPSPIDLELGLRARYGITRQAQIGVRYAIGGLYDDGKKDKVGWNTGKAVEINFTYLVADWIAPRVAIPMYVDPFSIGMVVGAPMQFRFGDRFAIVGFEELVGWKFQGDRFVPSLDSERENEAIADSFATNTIASDGFIQLDFGAIYQLEANLALTGRFGITFDDFADDDTASNLRVQVLYTPIRRLDLSALLGFDRLDEADNTFRIAGGVAIRI
ncbi:MAG: hypothetical protein KBG48_27070 [Kofleriaceae bacterium]|jgi:hypothetical protein|nr:hypothetical protein [Kofleriaceae bacterium]MBP9171090.1 hypothetical protein [Kofleriaceae bacterium]MBP9861250.1 hypothetical protein [Kofleriaceae bacterium]